MSSEHESPTVGGVVLCGGHSRRMGKDKAWLPLAGQTLLQRTVDRLVDVAEPIVVVRAYQQQLPPLPSTVRVTSDAEPDQGPLRGLQAGLAAVADDCDLIFVVGCDAPLLQPEFVRLLRSRLGEHQAVVVRDNHRLHPLGAVYRCDVDAVVERLLNEGKRRLLDLVSALDCHQLHPGDLEAVDPDLASLRNINTPDDYQRLLSEAHLA